MGIKSWFEDMRYGLAEEANCEEKRQKALAEEAKWRAEDGRPHTAEDAMHSYANLLMEPELKALGKHVVKLCRKKEDKWMLVEVYRQYGRYYMFANKPKEAVKWLEKSLRYAGDMKTFFVWQDLAAAYVESGNYQKADAYIQLYMDYMRQNNMVSRYTVLDFAKFYVAAKYYERAVALLLESHPDDVWHMDDKLVLAKAYFGLNEAKKGYAIYEVYLLKHPDDDYAISELALAYYKYSQDFERSEAMYFKCIEVAKKVRKDTRNWDMQVYQNLSSIFASEGIWDKCFYYLKLHFQHKYEGHEADVFTQLIDTMPAIESDEMGAELYLVIMAFEQSPIRASMQDAAATNVSENPSDEVASAQKSKGDFSSLFNWDDMVHN